MHHVRTKAHPRYFHKRILPLQSKGKCMKVSQQYMLALNGSKQILIHEQLPSQHKISLQERKAKTNR